MTKISEGLSRSIFVKFNAKILHHKCFLSEIISYFKVFLKSSSVPFGLIGIFYPVPCCNFH